MNFLHPAILIAGVLAVAIPIAIHFLMRRRRRPVPWAAMRFLVEAYRRRKRRLQLERILLLLARCALVLLLGIGLARPLLGGSGGVGSGPTLMIVLVDDSLTSRVERDADPAIERNKAIAARAIESLDQSRGDRAAVITLGAPARALVGDPSADLGAVERAIRDIHPTDALGDLAGAIGLTNRIIERHEDARVVVMLASDLLAGSTPAGDLPALSSADRDVRVLAPEPAPGVANVSIAAVDPARRVLAPDEAGGRVVRVSLARSGPEDALPGATNVVITDATTGRRLGETRVRWERGQRARDATIALEPEPLRGAPGPIALRATIDTDALPADDERHAIAERRAAVRVGLASAQRAGRSAGIGRFAPADWAALALQPSEEDSVVELERFDPTSLDSARLARLDALVVLDPDRLDADAWARVAGFVDAGGLVLITPPAGVSSHAWADPMTRALEVPWTIGRETLAFDPPVALDPESAAGSRLLGVIGAEVGYLAPSVRVSSSVRLTLEAGEGDPDLTLADATPWVVSHRRGQRGVVVILTSALDLTWTDLPARPLVVPLMQELIRQGVGEARLGADARAGERASVPRGAVELLALAGDADEPAARVGPGHTTDAPVRTAGVRRALDDEGATRGLVAVNPDERASDTTARARAELDAHLEPMAPAGVEWIAQGEGGPDVGAALAAGAERASLSLPALVAAALFALFELVLARFGSHADRSEASGGDA